MINAFFDAEVYMPYLINPNTNEKYVNPDGDLHCLAACSMYPELKSIPKWEVLKESKKDMGGWSRRDRGKVCGFTTIYGGSANRISTALQIDIKLAEKLLNSYFELFPELKTYIDNTSTLAKYQKWVACPVTNRRYWIAEDNAKGLSDANTSARRACNTLIQGISSIMMKKGAYYIDELFTNLNNKYKQSSKPGKLTALIHDECVTYIPGEGKLIDLKKVNNIWIPSYKFPDISYEYAQAQEQGMRKAMDELLHKLIPDFPSKADCKLGTSWAAK